MEKALLGNERINENQTSAVAIHPTFVNDLIDYDWPDDVMLLNLWSKAPKGAALFNSILQPTSR